MHELGQLLPRRPLGGGGRRARKPGGSLAGPRAQLTAQVVPDRPDTALVVDPTQAAGQIAPQPHGAVAGQAP